MMRDSVCESQEIHRALSLAVAVGGGDGGRRAVPQPGLRSHTRWTPGGSHSWLDMVQHSTAESGAEQRATNCGGRMPAQTS